MSLVENLVGLAVALVVVAVVGVGVVAGARGVERKLSTAVVGYRARLCAEMDEELVPAYDRRFLNSR